MRMSSSPIKRLAVSASLIALCLLFAVTSSAQQPVTSDTKAADRPSASITGRVVNRGGEPIAGAVAYVSSVGGRGPSLAAPVDSAGSFKVTGLEAGIYRVSASVPGYVTDPPPDSPRYYHEGDDVTITLIKGGVITGKVTTAADEPVVATSVRAYFIRDENGKAVQSIGAVRERATDDRGVYRIYGLPPGTYVVSTGGSLRIGPINVGAHDNDVPVYAPASTRDTAAEIYVGSGEEANADIQYRADPGHSVSGTLSGGSQNQSQNFYSNVYLLDVHNRFSLMSAPASPLSGAGFVFYGVPDGEYQLYASQFRSNQDPLSSDPLRVKVAGADVAGLKLTLTPLASIEGRAVLEKDPHLNCGRRRDTALKEIIVSAGRFDPGGKPATATDTLLPFMNTAAQGIPAAGGLFTLRSLQHGTYSIETRASAFGWYVRSITIGTATRVLNLNIPRDGITLKSGDRVTGLTVAIAEGGADLRGHVSIPEGQKLPRDLRVYLAPAERESADNVLRFYEGRLDNDGNFAVGNLAPGRYWIIARPAPDTVRVPRSIRQDSTLRSQVLADAQTSKKEVVFKPCEQLKDFDLHYTPASPRNR